MTGAGARTYDGTQAMIGAPHSSNAWAARKETRVYSEIDQMETRAYLTPRAELDAALLGRSHIGSPTNPKRRIRVYIGTREYLTPRCRSGSMSRSLLHRQYNKPKMEDYRCIKELDTE
jgi:hypothetical protein